ncbi:hypothetical protein N752_01805 [Desulforamulus aquiferis]|nr:peptidoglycan binding domain-containing protein [Desulforamulus aquiferis]RYD06888.1 hypothetical protein N752_01805 [Desulforamulus aquiferis]
MNKVRLTTFVTFALGIQLFVSIGLSTAVLKLFYRDSILPGISVEGVDIGGLNYQQALTTLEQGLPWPSLNNSLVLVGQEGKTTEIQFSSIDFRVDYEGIAKEAINYSQRASTWQDIRLLFGTMNTGHKLPAIIHFDKEAFSDILNELANQFNQRPRDAQYAITGDKVTLFQDVKGSKLDVHQTIKQLEDLSFGQHKVNLQFEVIDPTITVEQYKGINSRLAIFVTQFSLADGERTHNVKLASDLINNLLIKPGELFSMNNASGLGVQNQVIGRPWLLLTTGWYPIMVEGCAR